MDCNEYENLITEFLENTASPSQRLEMESHLAECEKCRAMAEQEKSVMRQLSAISVELCPDEVIDRVMETISVPGISLKERIQKWIHPGFHGRYGIASFAGVFAIIVMLLFFNLPEQQRQPLEAQKYSPEEIQQATAEARLALAYFAVYSRKAETTLEQIDLDGPVIKPIEREFKKAFGKIPYI